MRDLNSLSFDRIGWRRPSRLSVRPHCQRTQRARLTGLLAPAPHVVPEKKAKKKAMGTRRSSQRQVISDSSSGGSEADSSPEDEEEEEDSLPEEGEKKRKASPIGEAEGSKRGRCIPPDSFANTIVGEEEWPSRARRPARS